MRSRAANTGISTAFLLVLGVWPVWGGELPGDLAAQYRQAVDKLKAFYANVSVDGTLLREYPQSQKLLKQDFTYRSAGKKARLDLATRASRGGGAKVGSKQMLMATPYGSLETSEKRHAPDFDDARQDTYRGNRTAMDSICPLIYAYAVDSQMTLYDLLMSPFVKITSVKVVKRDSERLARIEFVQEDRSSAKPTVWQGAIVLAPEQGWVCCEFIRFTGQGSDRRTLRRQLAYSMGEGGIPMLQSIQSEEEQGDGVVFKETLAVSKFTPGAAKDSYFTADAFSPDVR